MNRQENPFRPPNGQVESIKGNSSSGCLPLATGVLAVFAATSLMVYLMIGVVPDLKDTLSDRNERFDAALWMTVRSADFFCKYWFGFLILFLAIILRNEFYSEPVLKRNFRKAIGILFLLSSILISAWMLWVTVLRYQ